MSLDSYTPDQISAFWAGVTAAAAVVTGGVAIVSLRSVRRDSRDRSRPVIGADLLPVVLSHGTSELVVQNVGPSVAKNVRVSFDPPIAEDMGVIAGFLARRYAEVIPTMGPGRRLTNIYSHWQGDGSNKLDENVPMTFRVSIKYEDSHGRKYTDFYDLDVATLRNQTTSSPSNTDPAGLRRRMVKALEEIARGVSAT